jgi:hypothetical protein
MMAVFAEGVSEMETLTDALPFCTQFVVQAVFGPLQDEKTKAEARSARGRALLRFMEHPTTE